MENINLGELGHTLKSPLVTIKSLAFLIKNKIDKNDKGLIKSLEEIEAKADILNSRIDSLIKYLEYQKGEVEFLYEIFNISDFKKEIQKKFKVKINFFEYTIIADKEKLILAISSFLNLFPTKEIRISTRRKNQIVFELFFPNKLQIAPKILSSEEFIAYRIIELHNGSVKKEVNKLQIIIPQKPVRKKI